MHVQQALHFWVVDFRKKRMAGCQYSKAWQNLVWQWMWPGLQCGAWKLTMRKRQVMARRRQVKTVLSCTHATRTYFLDHPRGSGKTWLIAILSLVTTMHSLPVRWSMGPLAVGQAVANLLAKHLLQDVHIPIGNLGKLVWDLQGSHALQREARPHWHSFAWQS